MQEVFSRDGRDVQYQLMGQKFTVWFLGQRRKGSVASPDPACVADLPCGAATSESSLTEVREPGDCSHIS